jgi:hypothetical protein
MTTLLRRAAVLGLVAALAVTLTGCATKIQSVMADPSRYRDREVKVHGYVTDSFSLLGRGAYKIEDRSGSIWVISQTGVPRKGAEVTVKGTVKEALNLGALTERLHLPGGGVVLMESGHRASGY